MLIVLSPQTTLETYPCGSDHTPSPMASRTAVEAEPILDSPSARLTAVAISVRVNHTIAFLGDSKGNLHKVIKSSQYILICVSFLFSAMLSTSSRQSLNHLRWFVIKLIEKRPIPKLGAICKAVSKAKRGYFE